MCDLEKRCLHIMADALAEGTEKDMAAGLLPVQVPLLSPPSPQSRRRMWRAESTAPGGQGSPSTASPATSEVPTAWWATRRWADCSCRSLRLRAPQPPPHADQRLDQIPGVHPCQGPLRMLRGRLLLGKPRTSEPWRSTPSYPGTRAVRTTSATCRPSAFAAMPASDGRREAGAHRRADGWGR